MFSSQNSKAHSKPLQCYILPAGCARSVRPAGPKIAFMFSVCVCVCVCVRPKRSRTLRYYATIATSAVEAAESFRAQ